MAINDMAKLRAVYPPPAAQPGLRSWTTWTFTAATSSPCLLFTSSVSAAPTGEPTPLHGAIRQDPWRTYRTTRRCYCLTGRETVRWTR